jgi:hypothetical protein
MCVINAFKLWSQGQQHPGQLRFREELMLELLKQLPAEQKPHKASARPHPATALAKDHYPARVQADRDCAQCSQRGQQRQRSSFICHACGVHLCIGDCFAEYHAEQ